MEWNYEYRSGTDKGCDVRCQCTWVHATDDHESFVNTECQNVVFRMDLESSRQAIKINWIQDQQSNQPQEFIQIDQNTYRVEGSNGCKCHFDAHLLAAKERNWSLRKRKAIPRFKTSQLKFSKCHPKWNKCKNVFTTHRVVGMNSKSCLLHCFLYRRTRPINTKCHNTLTATE